MAYRTQDSVLAAVLRQVDEDFLRPEAAAVREAEQRADRLVQELHTGPAWMFRVVGAHKHGSLSRGTGLRNFKDLDRLVELDPVALRTRADNERSAGDTIARMAAWIQDRRGGLVSMGTIQVRPQEHSVGVIYPASGFHIDLVPAVRRDGHLEIPERGTGLWLRTNPAGTADRLNQAKARAPHTGIAVRLIKGWSRARGRNAPIGSFAVETLVVNAMLEQPEPLDEAVDSFFRRIASAHAGRRMVLGDGDPEGAVTLIEPVSGNNLTRELSSEHRSTLVAACRSALAELGDVATLAEGGRTRQALTAARRLFVGTWA